MPVLSAESAEPKLPKLETLYIPPLKKGDTNVSPFLGVLTPQGQQNQ
jgi:hypothetical protein